MQARLILGHVLVGSALSYFAVAPRQALGDAVLLSPSRDTTLYQDASGAVANGAGDWLFAGRTDQANLLSRRRALVHFNIAGSIPSNATIDSVQLTMVMTRTLSGSATIQLHRVNADWGEGTSDALGEEGAGAPAQPDDATWLHRRYASQLWETAGGDFEVAPSASKLIVGLGSYAWDSTPGLVADVQSWLDDPSSNHGWLMLGPEVFAGTAKRFDSRTNPIVENRPVLRVDFTPQVPATSIWGLIVLVMSVAAYGVVLIRSRHSDCGGA